MSLEEDINAFRLWAANLGFPPDKLPGEEALKFIFKSPQRELFYNMMKRVLPRQEVEKVRANLLVSEMAKLKGQILPTTATGRSFLPKQLQIHLRKKDCEKKRSEVEGHVAELKKEYETLASSIKSKNIQAINLNHRHETLLARVNLLELKSLSIDDQLSKEKQNKYDIEATMPARLSSRNSNEDAASEAIGQAIKELEAFYDLCKKNRIPASIIHDARTELWERLRGIFNTVPSYLLFNVIIRLKEDQLQMMMAMNKTTLTGGGPTVNKKPLSQFDIKLMMMKAENLGLAARYLKARNERIALEERFAEVFGPFIEQLESKVNLFNVDAPKERIEEAISDYMAQYNLCNFNKSRNEFLTQQIDELKADITRNAKQLAGHDELIGTVKQLYADIHTSINQIFYDIALFGQVKEKILHSKQSMQLMLNNFHRKTSATAAKSNFLQLLPPMPQSTLPAMKLNDVTISVGSGGGGVGGVNGVGGGGGESFELDSENVFCSTKLDLNGSFSATLMRSFNGGGGGNSTLLPAGSSEQRSILPPHLMEFNMFVETPFEKFSCVSPECAFYFYPNPLVIETRELSSTIQLAPGTLLTPFGAIQEVRNRIAWASQIADRSMEVKTTKLDLITVDHRAVEEKMKQQRNRVTELLDNINVTAINTKRTLQQDTKIYKLIVDNTLRHYIPPERTYNGLTYAECESEFMMYYRMATMGRTMK